MNKNQATASQRRFIESLTKGMSKEEIATVLGRAGHTGNAANPENVSIYTTVNQMLANVTKRQASEVIDLLKK